MSANYWLIWALRHCPACLLSWVDFGSMLEPLTHGSISSWLHPLCGSGAAPAFCGSAEGATSSAHHVQTLQHCTPHCPGWGHPPAVLPKEGLSLTAQDNELFCHLSVVSSPLPASLGICCQNCPSPFHHSHFFQPAVASMTGTYLKILLVCWDLYLMFLTRTRILVKEGKISDLPAENPGIYSKSKCSILLPRLHREIASENLGLCLLHIL